MTNLQIFDRDKKVAEIAPDESGAVRLIFPQSIEEEIKGKVFTVFTEIKISKPESQVKELTEGYEQKGYKVYKAEDENKPPVSEKREASPEQKREVAFLHESNLIEHVTEITYEEMLDALVEDKFGGHVSAWRFAKTLAEDKTPLTPEYVCQMQKLITDEQSKFQQHFIAPKYRGKMRDCLVSIGGNIVDVPKEEDYKEFFRKLNGNIKQIKRDDLEGVLKLAAQSHLEYEKMHPFVDGNGRTGRLIVNYILEYFGYSPLVCTSVDKKRYYLGFMVEDIKDTSKMEEYFLEQYKLNKETFHA